MLTQGEKAGLEGRRGLSKIHLLVTPHTGRTEKQVAADQCTV